MKSIDKAIYLATSTAKWVARMGIRCPSCGNLPCEVVDRKYLVTQLRRCGACQLMYRTPTGSPSSMTQFYQHRYSEGFTTDMPSEDRLSELLGSNFKGTEKDCSAYVDVLRSLGGSEGMRILDFGCSWGYGSWQLRAAGFEVKAIEISTPRRNFARDRLRIDAYGTLSEVRGPFDFIFSSHVLEHVPDVSSAIRELWSLLKLGGKLVAVTPNGSLGYRSKHAVPWHTCWGLVHPNMLDERYYQKLFFNEPVLFATPPYPLADIRSWASTVPLDLRGDGDELLCVVSKHSASPWG